MKEEGRVFEKDSKNAENKETRGKGGGIQEERRPLSPSHTKLLPPLTTITFMLVIMLVIMPSSFTLTFIVDFAVSILVSLCNDHPHFVSVDAAMQSRHQHTDFVEGQGT